MDIIELEKRIKSLEKQIIEINNTPLHGYRAYFLKFFQGTREELKIFLTTAGLTDAINEARDHCQRMGYRFGAVRPAIVDLKHQENLKFSTKGEWHEDMEEPTDLRKRLAAKGHKFNESENA